MTVVLDASVALKWFLADAAGEDHVAQALGLLGEVASGEVKLLQPPHFVAEVAAVLARLKPRQALDDVLDLLDIEFETADDPGIYARALELAIRHQHHVFDTLYHAVALETPGAEFITADGRYFEKARSEGRMRLLATA